MRVVIVHKIDRFYRNTQGLLNTHSLLTKQEILFVSISENTWPTPTGLPPNQSWTDLFDPARLSTFVPSPQPQQTAITTHQRLARLPEAISHRLTPQGDVLVLRTFWQVFRERGLLESAFPPADLAFFQAMNPIHGASLVDDDSPLQQAALPRMSLLLLAQLLRVHPQLKQALQHAIPPRLSENQKARCAGLFVMQSGLTLNSV